ncbi:insulinase family protein [Nakamurella flava]|uniref:Insulinase family protein n=1 Tax=Nakamurella flava TaxID=2576308 RepID=A0A4U6QMQ7_9ACTN|nr:pitrilysin family protein [Nakamurella flava]TKV61366.1 insulinase family protein [Nakamurella flava]
MSPAAGARAASAGKRSSPRTAASTAGSGAPKRSGKGTRARAAVPAFRSAEDVGRTDLGPRPVPPLGAAGRVRRPTVKHADLDSGLHVVAVRVPRTPLVEVRLRVPFGGRNAVHAARAELLAATVLLGSSTRTREEVDAELATVGGHLDANVDPQRLSVTGSVLSTGLGTLLDVLADCLLDPAYRRADVRGERDRLVQHLLIGATQPATIAHQALQRRRFGDHPAALDIPEPELVAAVTPAAVAGLHRRAVVPAGSTLVLVGDLSPARAIDMVASALGGWTSENRATLLKTPPAVAPGAVLLHARAGVVQSQVRLSAAAPTRDEPDYPALQLANLIYGGYFSSRLVENIREAKGYTYSARSSLEFWPGRAALTVAFDTATEATAPALLEARYELGRISLQAPTAAEVDAARNYALGTLATSLATQAGLASTLSMLAGLGLDEKWLAGHPGRLGAVTVDEVAAAAGRVLAPSAFTGVVVGDPDQVAAPLQALGGVELADGSQAIESTGTERT